MHVIKLVSRSDGVIDSHSGRYLKSFDPSQGQFIGGVGCLVTTPVKTEALAFPSLVAAMAFWRAEHGGPRPWDGQPNRPLTAYTVEIVSLDPVVL